MSGKGKRRREARRRAKQRQEEQPAAQTPQTEGGAEPAAAAPREERPAAREPVAHSRAARKRPRRGGGLWERVGRTRVSGWLIGVPVVVASVIVFAVLILTSGSSGSSGPKIERTPDPRVARQTPTATYEIEARGAESGSFYAPDTVTAPAGEVIAITVRNTGTVSHNMRVSGPDKEYDTADDFEMPPNVIKPGESETLVVKIDEPGSYPFRCDFHPLDQKGTLVLQ
ncbi:MAG TPA: cupredoxin domain-containing protein [Dehalococcoidia bacterium]|nr:cupredoxin domain-containing protein [Dehalococcoidia bacterium]